MGEMNTTLKPEPIDKLADIYKRINEACEQDEAVLEQCRETFKRLEDGDEYCTELWNRFKELSFKKNLIKFMIC